MSKILVTGGLGYIGSHTIVELDKAGYTPIIIDNLSNSSTKNIIGIEKIIQKKLNWYNIDCKKEDALNQVLLKEGNIHGAIHFAAYKSVEESIKYPKKYHDNNIGSLETLLNCMRKNNIKNIIFSSSCTVYGNPETLPVDENTPFKKAESPYSETKQICENILKRNSCNSVILRYFNPIGCHNSGLIGDYSNDKPTNLVPIITETAIGKRDNVTIFGDNHNTPDGTCIRDYIHVVDLAQSHTKALNYLIKNKGKHVFNIGTGKGVSVKEIINAFIKANNIKINYSIGKKRSGDIEKIWANCNLANKELNWKAKKSINQSMIDAWKWEKYKNNHVI